MGGDLSCEGTFGEGSSFTAVIPVRLVERAIDEVLKDRETKYDPCGNAVILLAEDEPVNSELMEALLESLGHEVHVTKNGEQALEVASGHSFDLILMDISMPKMDGLEATRRIRKLAGASSKTPIVAMTAHVTREDREACLSNGMNDYLAKPISYSKLRTVLSRWLVRNKV